MKLAVFLMLITVLQVTAGSYAQTITLRANNLPLPKVMEHIQAQSGYLFFLKGEKLANIKVNTTITKTELNEAMDILTKDLGLEWVIREKTIILRSAEQPTIKKTTARIDLIPQERIITGKVIDENGKPLQGAAVRIKNSSVETSTGKDGHFKLAEVPDDAFIVVSFIGYEVLELPISANLASIVMDPQVSDLDEVVVVGYGTLRKRDVTGSVLSLTPKDLNTVNAISADQMMQGRTPGVQITQSSQAPGGGVSVRIRGVGSINAGNEPLYVIDGVPIDNRSTASGNGSSNFRGDLPSVNPLNTLNPADIASIEILKDASATAIYGSRGANGVVLITTKSGGEQFVGTYNVQLGSARIARKMDVLGAQDYMAVMNELAETRGQKPVFDSDYIANTGAGTDWQNEIFRQAISQNHSVSLSGGSGKSNFYSSLNYTDQNGIVKLTQYQRFQGRLNFEHTVNERFKFGFNFNTSQENNFSVPVNGFSINQDADAINSALNTPPVFPVLLANGKFYRPESGEPISVTLDNPVAIIEGQRAKDRINRTLANIFGEYQIVDGLNARVNIASDRINSRRDIYVSRISQVGNSVGGSASVQSGELGNILLEGTINFNKTIQEVHAFNAVAGITAQQFDERTVGVGTKGFPSDVAGTNNLGQGTVEFNTAGSYFGRRRLLSYLARVNYGFQGKYLLTGTIRADGSSNFGSNNRFGYFPSFSAAWNIEDEDFLSNVQAISSLKLRVGWGQIGNDDIGIGTALSTYVGNGNVVLDGDLLTAIAPARIPNPNLKWETSQQTNFGLDFGLFDNRLRGSVDYFFKNNKDLLFNLPIPSSSGFAIYTNNIGQISNKGVELLLSSDNLNGSLKWRTTFNLAKILNSVDNLGGISEYVPSNEPTTIVRPGVALFSYYGFRQVGVFQSAEEIALSAQPNAQIGDARWEDVTPDGTINDQDRVVLGNPYPDMTLGLSNDFEYGNLTLSVFLEGALGVDMFHWQTVDALYANDPYRNRMAEPMLNRWTPENQSTRWPSGVSIAQLQYSRTNSLTIRDASYIRLKNVQVSYLLPLRAPKAFKSVRMFLSGQNLALITDYPGFDPDVNATGTGNIRYDRNAYPASRTFLVGFNLNF